MAQSAMTVFGTTVDYCEDQRFFVRTHLIREPPPPPPGRYNFVDEARLFLRVTRAALKERVLLLYSSRGLFKPELLAAAALSFWPKRFRPLVIFYGDMYEPNHALRHKIERFVIKLADRAICRYITFSPSDAESFAATWQIDPRKVRACHAFANYANRQLLPSPVPYENYIFAGGDSFRDYDPLLRAAALMPEQTFVISTSRLKERTDLPPNVIVTSARFQEYVSLMQSARAVVVPLRRGTRRSAGIGTFLNAMWLKKPCIVTDALGVRDFLENGVTGLIVDGTPESYVNALRWLLDPANETEASLIGSAAHEAVAARFTVESHVTTLLALVDEAIQEEGLAGKPA